VREQPLGGAALRLVGGQRFTGVAACPADAAVARAL